MPFWVANLLQALLFGVFHMNMIQGVYAFVVGIVLGFICEKSHSIYPSMLFHILFNIWGTFSPDWFMYKADTVPFFFLWFFVGAGLLVAGLLLFFFGVNKKYPKIEKFLLFLISFCNFLSLQKALVLIYKGACPLF